MHGLRISGPEGGACGAAPTAVAPLDQAKAAERFETMYDACHPRVRGLVRRLIADPGTADDIVQEAFLRAYTTGLHLEAGDADPWPWLAAVARNLSLDALRRQQRLIEAPIEDHPDEAGGDAGPEREAMRSVDLEGIEEALAAIAPRHRDILVLRHFRGWCYRDIAATEGLSQEALKSLLARARRNFRRQYVARAGRYRALQDAP